MRNTNHDLDESVRRTNVERLNAVLANATHLALQAKHAHWNVQGPHFSQLHSLYERLYRHAVSWMDTIGERIIQIGGHASGTLESVSQRTRLVESGLRTSRESDFVDDISAALSTFSRGVRASATAVERTGDPVTSHLLVGVCAAAEKMLWLVEANRMPQRPASSRSKSVPPPLPHRGERRPGAVPQKEEAAPAIAAAKLASPRR